MPTRLQVQENIKNYLFLTKVRVIQTDEPFQINVYFEDLAGKFVPEYASAIKEICPAHLCVTCKPYKSLLEDNVPPEIDFPEIIQHFALITSGNMQSFQECIKKALPDMNIVDIKFIENTINVETDTPLSAEKLLYYSLYAQEIAPLGVAVMIHSLHLQ